MKQIFKSLVTRLNNKGTIVSLAALIVSLLCQFGLNIDSEKILTIVQTICSILIILGLLNDPTDNTKGYIPGNSDPFARKEETNDGTSTGTNTSGNKNNSSGTNNSSTSNSAQEAKDKTTNSNGGIENPPSTSK